MGMQQGEKPGDERVPLLPDVKLWEVPQRQADVYAMATVRFANQQARQRSLASPRRHFTAPAPRGSWRERFVSWWCSHASDFAKGVI